MDFVELQINMNMNMLEDGGCAPDLRSVEQKHRSGKTITGEGHLGSCTSAGLLIHAKSGIFMLNIFCN
jgi:hypothetical protein